MIAQIQDNFLTDETCAELINFFEENKNLQEIYRNTFVITITNIDRFKDLLNKINNYFLKHNAKVDWIQIVKWPVNSFQLLHNDTASDQTTLSSICYLNDNYSGGQTFFEEGTVFTPKKRRMLFFDGMYYKHGVTMVHGEIRYTLATWYKQNEKIKF